MIYVPLHPILNTYPSYRSRIRVGLADVYGVCVKVKLDSKSIYNLTSDKHRVLSQHNKMATGYSGNDNEAKRKKGKDLKCKILCDTCSQNHITTDGDVYCVDCNDYFCNKCFRVEHRDTKRMADHTIVRTEDFVAGAKPNQELTDTCRKHVKLLVDIFCKTHNVVACNKCMKENHK